MKRIAIPVLVVVPFLLSACSGLDTREQRALTGGAIGAAGGAVIGAIAGVPAIGAAVGGAGGALIGGLTSPRQVTVDPRQKTQ
jgi:hypothetical protein